MALNSNCYRLIAKDGYFSVIQSKSAPEVRHIYDESGKHHEVIKTVLIDGLNLSSAHSGWVTEDASCLGCKRMSKRGCKVFTEKPKKCWAWTDDPDWEKKVRAAVVEYRKAKGW